MARERVVARPERVWAVLADGWLSGAVRAGAVWVWHRSRAASVPVAPVVTGACPSG